eukprot:m.272465 g.272465  ORF g.272465 m.272465 type:complete len:223 (+) comp40563_c0_seq3:4151-4819(+)
MVSKAVVRPTEAQSESKFVEDIAAGVFAQVLPKTTGATKGELAEHGIKEPGSEAARKMAGYLKTVGDKLDQDTQLGDLMDDLTISADTVYDTFKDVALNIFRSGITWGRVAVLFMFGAKLAVRVFYDTPTIIKKLLEWVARFVTERLSNWIIASGGWSALATFVAERFVDSMVLTDSNGEATDSPDGGSSRPPQLTSSNWKWLAVGVGLGVAVTAWFFTDKS